MPVVEVNYSFYLMLDFLSITSKKPERSIELNAVLAKSSKETT